jgi:hypothetical protein
MHVKARPRTRRFSVQLSTAPAELKRVLIRYPGHEGIHSSCPSCAALPPHQVTHRSVNEHNL